MDNWLAKILRSARIVVQKCDFKDSFEICQLLEGGSMKFVCGETNIKQEYLVNFSSGKHFRIGNLEGKNRVVLISHTSCIPFSTLSLKCHSHSDLCQKIFGIG